MSADIPDELIPFLSDMMTELEQNRLVVEKGRNEAPHGWKDDEGRWIRVATSSNPQWYSDLWNMFPKPLSKQMKGRAPGKSLRSNISRWKVIKVLGWMIKNKKSRSMYAEHLLEVAAEKHKNFNADPDDVDWMTEMYS